MTKLNLGCGSNPMPGWVNVDKFESLKPDLVHDLERLPWPWPNDSVAEINLFHVLEHLGQETRLFLGIMQELYRICRHGAVIHVAVPHPRHDDFINDPTHVRPVTAEMLYLFDRQANLEWRRLKAANSQLALALNVDFAVSHVQIVPSADWRARLQSGEATSAELERARLSQNNVIQEIRLRLTVRKESATAA
jgi:hypothetical protein